MLVRLCSKSFKLGFSSTWTKNFQMHKQGWEKEEEPEIIANIHWIIEKAREFQKNIYSASLSTLKLLTVWITANCGKFLMGWEYLITLPTSWETCMQVKRQQWEPDMEQWIDSKLGKECVKAVYCYPDHLTDVQSTSCKMPGWMKHEMKSILTGEISTTSDMKMIQH